MTAVLSIKTNPDASRWVAGQVIREGAIREDILQNIQYLLDSLGNVASSQFWELYAQQHQVGDVLGSPLP